MQSTFRCDVCYEQCIHRLPLPKLTTTNGDVIRQADCMHPICRDCVAGFVRARVEQHMVFGVRCPSPGCRNEIQEQDVQALAKCGALAQEISDRFSELRKQDYTARAMSFSFETALSTDDLGLMRRLWSTTRRCPRCNVIMEKASGCDSFGCICGHKFNFATAPRGCGDGIHDFNSVISLCKSQELSVADAMKLVSDAGKKGIKRYDVVLSLASRLQIDVAAAELHARAFFGEQSALEEFEAARRERRTAKKVQVLSANLGIDQLEAMALLEKAKNGDQAAWALIRKARALDCMLGLRVLLD